MQIYFGALILIDVPSIIILLNRLNEAGSFNGYTGGLLLALIPPFMTTIALIVCFILLYSERREKLINFLLLIKNKLYTIRYSGLVLLSLLGISYCVTWILGIKIPVLWLFPELWVVGNLAVILAIFLSQLKRFNPINALVISFSGFALALSIMYYLPEISTYPLSLDWSESSRFYDASLFLSRSIYGKRFPLPALDPTRAFMQSFPFLFPALPIWVHRLWRVLLWIGSSFLTGYALARRMNFKDRVFDFGLAAWFMIFSFQGPMYFHLIVVVTIVFLGFNKNRLWRSLFFVGLASLWAGASRVNWFPVAGMIAATLYILEIPIDGKRFWQYWRWPLLAVFLGLVFAFVGQALYGLVSGNPPQAFVTSFDSPLLRYRLFPNMAFGPGVIRLMLAASFPLLLIVFWILLKRFRNWNFLRILALFSILGALLIAGLVVSTKIGGGNNLHNLDSFLIALVLVSVYVAFNKFAPDRLEVTSSPRMLMVFFLFAFLVPLISLIESINVIPVRDNERAWEDIESLQLFIDDVAPDGEGVLFIQDRHLLSFGMIENVHLIHEYEKVFLMEMAMSGNEAYLDQFREDLRNHRFALIVMEPMSFTIYTPNHPFAEENNAWVEQVDEPLAAYYHIALDLTDSGMVVLLPNE